MSVHHRAVLGEILLPPLTDWGDRVCPTEELINLADILGQNLKNTPDDRLLTDPSCPGGQITVTEARCGVSYQIPPSHGLVYDIRGDYFFRAAMGIEDNPRQADGTQWLQVVQVIRRKPNGADDY